MGHRENSGMNECNEVDDSIRPTPIAAGPEGGNFARVASLEEAYRSLIKTSLQIQICFDCGNFLTKCGVEGEYSSDYTFTQSDSHTADCMTVLSKTTHTFDFSTECSCRWDTLQTR